MKTIHRSLETIEHEWYKENMMYMMYVFSDV